MTTRGLPIQERFMLYAIADPISGCWLWGGAVDKDGYGVFMTRIDGVKKTNKAHRFSWELHNEKIAPGLCVLHKCDIPSCVNPSHLYTGTPQENMDDMWRRGRGCPPKGVAHCRSKLNNYQVRIIRRFAAYGTISQREIGEVFGVHQSEISRILYNKAWKHVA